MATDIKRVSTVSRAPRTGARKTRTPRHNYHVEFKPYQIQPFCIAPVSAGDSLKNIRFEARVLTKPILDQVTGWWAENYWFYVRFSDLVEAADAKRLIVTPDDALTGLVTASNEWTYHAGSGPDWLAMALKPIIEIYFRKEGEAWNDSDALWGAVPIAGLATRSWVDTVDLTSALPAVPDDYTDRWVVYQTLRKQKLVTMEFDEYLRSQGVNVPDQLVEALAERRKPELLRFLRQFSYPANTVNPEDGSAASAVSWVVAERMDRAIFCDEPGFIVGCAIVRPKLYLSNQRQTAISNLRDARTWLPDLLVDAPQEVLDNRVSANPGVAQTPGSLTTNANYSYDVSGVFALGDQFLRGTAPDTALPVNGTMQKTYPLEADIDALFTADPAEGGVTMDGTAVITVTGRTGLHTTI